MHITWHGQYTVKLVSADSIIVIDPLGAASGLSPFRGKATHVALSNPTEPVMSYVGGIQGETQRIDSPGEYSFGPISLRAIAWRSDQGDERSIFIWRIEDMSIVHLGTLDRPLNTVEQQDLDRAKVDVLLLPIGGGTGLKLATALEVLSAIEPRVVIPIHFQVPGVTEKLTPVDGFAKEMGLSASEPLDKVILKASKLAVDKLVAVILKH